MPISWAKVQRTCVASVVMLVSMFILWWSIWMIGAAQYRAFIDDWIETHRPLGAQVTYDSRDTEGFPRYITLHFSNFVLQNSDGVRIHATDVSLAAFPWRWQEFDAKLKHGFELTIPFTGEKVLTIRTEATARNHTELGDNGDWKFVDLQLKDAKALWGQDPLFSAGDFAIALERPDIPPNNHTEPGLSVESSAENLTLPPGLDDPFGPQVAKIETALRVMGPVPDPRIRDSVAAWNGANGTIAFDKFFLHWGPLTFDATGTLGLDDDLQAEGVFSSRIGNHEEVLKKLMEQNYILRRDSAMLDSALKLFAKEAKISGQAGIEVPITVQLGGLFLGPVRMFEFPELMWQDDQPATTPPATAPSSAQ